VVQRVHLVLEVDEVRARGRGRNGLTQQALV
jgi:hypothetical protein